LFSNNNVGTVLKQSCIGQIIINISIAKKQNKMVFILNER